MYVPVDERVEQITGVLAGANCGACGCAGCADYAKSIVEEGNGINKCIPGGAKTAAAIAEIMGVEAGSICADEGRCGLLRHLREDLQALRPSRASPAARPSRACTAATGPAPYGCLGYGDCTRACAFDAIHIEDGIAKVDREKCTGCGACAAVCPNHVIERGA